MNDPSYSTPNELFALSDWFAALRRAGWFSQVPPEEWHTLSALLSFRRDGSCPFTPEQLAYVLGAEEGVTVRRLDLLSQFEWQGRPFVRLERDPYGQVAGASLAPLGLFDETGVPQEGAEGGGLPVPHARPILSEGGAKSTAVTARPGLYRELGAIGLYEDQIERLLETYPEDRIRRQLVWLTSRKARVPAAMLLRAVEGDWGPPKEGEQAEAPV